MSMYSSRSSSYSLSWLLASLIGPCLCLPEPIRVIITVIRVIRVIGIIIQGYQDYYTGLSGCIDMPMSMFTRKYVGLSGSSRLLNRVIRVTCSRAFAASKVICDQFSDPANTHTTPMFTFGITTIFPLFLNI